MRAFNADKTRGTNSENLYRLGYRNGQKEQIEQDLAMIEHLFENSEDCVEFRENLAGEIRRIKNDLDFHF